MQEKETWGSISFRRDQADNNLGIQEIVQWL